MSEKRTLSRWLRSEEIYRDENSQVSGPAKKQWRNALLSDLDPH